MDRIKKTGAFVVMICICLLVIEVYAKEESILLSPYALLMADSIVFESPMASSNALAVLPKGTLVLCAMGRLNADSSLYIWVYPDNGGDQTSHRLMGYIAYNQLQPISLGDVEEIRFGEKTVQEVLDNPTESSAVSFELEVINVDQGYMKTNRKTLVFAGPDPAAPINIELEKGDKVLVRMPGLETDSGEYCYVEVEGVFGFIMAEALENKERRGRD